MHVNNAGLPIATSDGMSSHNLPDHTLEDTKKNLMSPFLTVHGTIQVVKAMLMIKTNDIAGLTKAFSVVILSLMWSERGGG